MSASCCEFLVMFAITCILFGAPGSIHREQAYWRHKRMAIVATKASLFYRTCAKIQSVFGYGALLGCNLGGFLPLDFEPLSNKFEKDLNELSIGYPRNHNYRVCKKKS